MHSLARRSISIGVTTRRISNRAAAWSAPRIAAEITGNGNGFAFIDVKAGVRSRTGPGARIVEQVEHRSRIDTALLDRACDRLFRLRKTGVTAGTTERADQRLAALRRILIDGERAGNPGSG